MTVTHIQIGLIERRALPVATNLIFCDHASYSITAGALAYYDFERPTQELPVDADGNGTIDATIPNGVFTVDRARAETLEVTLRGLKGYEYLYIVQVTVVENGVERTETFGSQASPMHAIFLRSGTNRSYDYNFNTGRWEKVGS